MSRQTCRAGSAEAHQRGTPVLQLSAADAELGEAGTHRDWTDRDDTAARAHAYHRFIEAMAA